MEKDSDWLKSPVLTNVGPRGMDPRAQVCLARTNFFCRKISPISTQETVHEQYVRLANCQASDRFRAHHPGETEEPRTGGGANPIPVGCEDER